MKVKLLFKIIIFLHLFIIKAFSFNSDTLKSRYIEYELLLLRKASIFLSSDYFCINHNEKTGNHYRLYYTRTSLIADGIIVGTILTVTYPFFMIHLLFNDYFNFYDYLSYEEINTLQDNVEPYKRIITTGYGFEYAHYFFSKSFKNYIAPFSSISFYEFIYNNKMYYFSSLYNGICFGILKKVSPLITLNYWYGLGIRFTMFVKEHKLHYSRLYYYDFTGIRPCFGVKIAFKLTNK